MKFFKKFSIIIILFSWLCCFSSCRILSYDSCQKLEDLFHQNESAFRQAAAVLQEIVSDHDKTLSIKKSIEYGNFSYDNFNIKAVEDLYMISVDVIYTDEEYLRIYESVQYLFSNLDIAGIACDSSQLQFAIESYYGVEASICFTMNDISPSGSYGDGQEQSEIERNWFAVISHD